MAHGIEIIYCANGAEVWRNSMKTCITCGSLKSLDEFPKRKDSPDGRRNQCSECRFKCQQEYRERNRSSIEINRKKYYHAHREEAIAYATEWNRQNPDKNTAYRKAWETKNPGYYTQYWQEHLSNRRAIAVRYVAKKVSAQGDFTGDQWEEVKGRYGHQCLGCGKKETEITLTIDHIIPLSKGGNNSIENIQPLCQSCNSRKRQRTIDYRDRV